MLEMKIFTSFQCNKGKYVSLKVCINQFNNTLKLSLCGLFWKNL